MGAIASQITSLTIVYSTVYSDADERKHQSSASLAFVWGIHRGRVNSPHKWTVTRKMFPFDDVIMICTVLVPYTGMQVNLFIVPDNTDKLTTGTVSLQKTSQACLLGSHRHCKLATNITVIPWWAQWRLKSPAFRVFAEPFVQAQIKDNIKALRRWPLWGESTGDRWIPLTKDH